MEIKTFESLLNIAKEENAEIYSVVQKLEADFLEISVEAFRKRVFSILNIMKQAVKNGLEAKTLSRSGLSGENTALLKETLENAGYSLLSPFQKKAALYAVSTIEENARMGKIAACPTAGSSGIVPGVLISLADEFSLSDETLINALIVSGVIGEIISEKMALAGAVAGCQAECGTAGAMAAGAAVYILSKLNKNTDIEDVNQKIINAVALSLKNTLGLTCDPVAGLVEIPCVKRNIFVAMHALTAAELSLAGVKSKIPADDVTDAMKETGNLMAASLKESSEAGLAKTKTGLKIEETLKQKL